jgi:hypothetical protein
LWPLPIAFDEIVDNAASQAECQRGLVHPLQTEFRLSAPRGRSPTLGSEPGANPLPPAASQLRHFCIKIPEQLSPELRPGF